MKNKLLVVVIFLLGYSSVYAQSKGINFQSIVVDASGTIEVSQEVDFKFDFYYNSDLSTIIYSETQSKTTNNKGLVSLVIGDGTKLSSGAELADLDWSEEITLKVSRQVSGSYQLLFSQTVASVPIAFYAKKAGSLEGVTVASGVVSATDFLLNGSSLDSRIQLIEDTVASDVATVEEVTAVSDAIDSAQADIDDLLINIPNIDGIYSNTSVGSNTYFNYDNPNSVDNTAIGQNALQSNSASENTAVGAYVLQANTSGDSNTGLGAGVLYNNTTGFNNVALGVAALFENVSGRSNNAIGYDALRDNTGSYNVAIGEVAGYSNTTGNNNTLIGYQADVNSGALTNATATGANAKVSSSNTMSFGDSNVEKWGFGLATTDSGKAIQVGSDSTNGNGAYLTTGGTWTNGSSILFKTNFIDLDNQYVLDKISSIKVRKWDYRGTDETHIGPTSEEFTKAFGVGFTKDEKEDRHLSSIDVSGVALKGVQALYEKINQQKNKIEKMEQEILALKAAIEKLITE
jgi:hypothetical protein